MNRYVITYFPENSEHKENPYTFFVEASNEADAKEKCMRQFGTYIEILSCDLTKSCGGPGLRESTSNGFDVPDVVYFGDVQLEKVALDKIPESDSPTHTEENKSVKKGIKQVNRNGKLSNASLIRTKIAEAKSSGKDKEFVVEWAVATLGQTKSIAKSYVKNIWAE